MTYESDRAQMASQDPNNTLVIDMMKAIPGAGTSTDLLTKTRVFSSYMIGVLQTPKKSDYESDYQIFFQWQVAVSARRCTLPIGAGTTEQIHYQIPLTDTTKQIPSSIAAKSAAFENRRHTGKRFYKFLLKIG